jgi:WD40 repeat protein/serine/threonine protein kinase
MAAADDEPIVEQLASLLPAYDDALRDGTPLPRSLPAVSGAAERLERAQACVRRLRSKWRHLELTRSSDTVVDPDFGLGSTRLGRFEIVRPLGKGGHGIVFLASDPALRRTVALKVARPDTILDPDLHARLHREAEAAANLDHPNLIPVYELGQSGPWVYIVSAYCPGPNLADWLKDRAAPIPIPAAVDLVATLADAVAYMHSRGVLHRDIKPANIMLSTESKVLSTESKESLLSTQHSALSTSNLPLSTYVPKLTDFGLAKVMDDGLQQTRTGAVLGTPAYMSPEQAAGKENLGPGCDVYALGVLLFEILTRRLPFPAANAAEQVRRVAAEEPLRPRRLRRAVPRALETICLHCLHKEPSQRYAGAQELADDLRRFLRGEPIQARPPATWTRLGNWARRHARHVAFAAVALLAMLGTLALMHWRTMPTQTDSWQAHLKEAQEFQSWHLRYASQISAAERAWEGNHLAVLGELLNGLRPAPGQTDRRGFEWYYLWQRYQEEGFHFAGHGGLKRVAYSPDGKLLATAGMEGSIRLWDLATAQLRHTLHAHAGGVRTLVFAPDGQRLASGGQDGAIRVWDLASGQAVRAWPAHQAPVNCLAFSSDGLTLASGGDDHQLLLWNAATGQQLVRCIGHEKQIHAVVFVPQRNLLLSGAMDGTVRVWNGSTGEPLRVLSTSGYRLVLSPDGRWLVSGGNDGQVRLWDTRSWKTVATIPGTGTQVDSLAFSSEGSTFAEATCADKNPMRTVRLWDLTALTKSVPTNPRPWATLEIKGCVSGLAFAPRGRSLVIAGQEENVRLWYPRHPSEPAPQAISHTPDEAWCVAFAPDGKTLVSGGDNEYLQPPLKLSDAVTGKTLWTSRKHQALVSCVAWSPDGQWIASGSFDNTVQLIQPASGAVAATLPGHTGPLRCLAFSPDGRLLATAGRDRRVILWDVAARQQLLTFTGHTDEIRGLVFMPDGQRLVSASLDKTVRTWQVSTGAAVSLVENASGIDGLAVSPDGKLLAWGGEDGLSAVFDVATSQKRPLVSAHLGHVRALVFSPDGRTLATAGKDHLIQLWDSATGLHLLTLPGHHQELHDIAFSPRGDALASASHDGAVLVWRAAQVSSAGR